MAKIIGGTTSTPMRVPDWEQTNPNRADYIKNKPDLAQKADITYVDGKMVNTANALKGSAKSSGTVTINDVSPFTHDLLVTVSSKNKIPFPYTHANRTENGVTFTVNDDGSITINTDEGGATDKTAFFLHGNGATKPVAIPDGLLVKGAPYTLSALNGTMQNGVLLNINFYNKTGTAVISNGVYSGRKKLNFNAPVSGITWYLRLVIDEGTVLSDYTVYPQIEPGNDITDYTPYVDVDNVTVSLCGEDTSTPIATAAVEADGSVNGFVSQYPTTVLSADNEHAIIECEYNRDLNKAYGALVNAIISLGGNV